MLPATFNAYRSAAGMACTKRRLVDLILSVSLAAKKVI
jgi:hypothetical protein